MTVPDTEYKPLAVPDVETAETCWAAIAIRSRQAGEPIPSWEQIGDSERGLVTRMVRSFRLGACPREVHRRWRTERIAEAIAADDWDFTAAEHPWLVEWEDLPAHGRMVFRLIQHVTVALAVDADPAG